MPSELTPNGSEFTEDLGAPAIAPEGWPIVVGFVVGSAVLTALASLAGPVVGTGVGLVCAMLTVWCVWFFRDPRRRIPASWDGMTTLVSPADGVICHVGPALPPEELALGDEERRGLTRVSVFMNVFNVHVNRAPVAGRIEKLAYRPGKFFNASFDKASEQNERHSMVLRMADGRMLVCVQIAGLIARRIVCRVKEGASLMTGERYGIIRFGSRVDVYLPRGVESRVKVGDRSVAGETVFAVLGRAGAEVKVNVNGVGASGSKVGLQG